MIDVSKVDVWSAAIDDSPGGIISKIEDLVVKADLNLQFLLGERRADVPGQGQLYISPVAGEAQTILARRLGFIPNDRIFCLRVVGDDEPGIAYRILRALAYARINLRGVSVAGARDRFTMYIALDTPEDADAAAGIVRKSI